MDSGRTNGPSVANADEKVFTLHTITSGYFVTHICLKYQIIVTSWEAVLGRSRTSRPWPIDVSCSKQNIHFVHHRGRCDVVHDFTAIIALGPRSAISLAK